jgi:hypothetical protein
MKARSPGEAECLAAATATGDDVAKIIYEATTDGTNQLRYVPTEDIQPYVRARRETEEDSYRAFMHREFIPGHLAVRRNQTALGSYSARS